MQILHAIFEKNERFKLFRYHLKKAKDLRKDITKTIDGFTYKRGDSKYLKQVETLHLELFRQPLYSWLVWIYRFKAKELMSVVVDANDKVIAYDLFMFQPIEADENILHELYVGVAYANQDKGMGVKLRQYSIECYDEGKLSGLSTLAAFDNIKALRTAQKAGYAITKTSAKPLAHYLFKYLTKRY